MSPRSRSAVKTAPVRARVHRAEPRVPVSTAREIDADTDADTDEERAGLEDGIVVSSEAQRQLINLPASVRMIAKAIGASHSAVGKWRLGHTKPEAPLRRKLQEKYGIPVAAWRALDGSDDDPEDDDRPETDTAALLDRLIRTYTRELKRQDLTPREIGQFTDGLQRAVAQKVKIERDRELLEERIIRSHPRWRRLKRAIIDALLLHPEAARAVEAAIVRLIGEDEAEAEVEDMDK